MRAAPHIHELTEKFLPQAFSTSYRSQAPRGAKRHPDRHPGVPLAPPSETRSPHLKTFLGVFLSIISKPTNLQRLLSSGSGVGLGAVRSIFLCIVLNRQTLSGRLVGVVRDEKKLGAKTFPLVRVCEELLSNFQLPTPLLQPFPTMFFFGKKKTFRKKLTLSL